MAIGDLMGMMKQAKQLQEKMQVVQEEIAAMSIDRRRRRRPGLGRHQRQGRPQVGQDRSLTAQARGVEILEDLIVAAMSDARGKAEAAVAGKMQAMTGGLNLPPGMKLPF